MIVLVMAMIMILCSVVMFDDRGALWSWRLMVVEYSWLPVSAVMICDDYDGDAYPS